MIKTNGKAIGINTAPDPDFDFTVCNMPNGQHRLLRGVDVYDYVNTLDAAGELVDENGLVKYSINDKLPTSGLFYNTSTNTYTTNQLYTSKNIKEFFKEPSKKDSSLYSYKCIFLDLNQYKDYNYLIILSPAMYTGIYIDSFSNNIELINSCYNSDSYHTKYTCFCFKINNYSITKIFIDSNQNLSSYRALAVKEYQDYQNFVEILDGESFERATRFVNYIVVADTLENDVITITL